MYSEDYLCPVCGNELIPSCDDWEEWETTRKPGDYRKITI